MRKPKLLHYQTIERYIIWNTRTKEVWPGGNFATYWNAKCGFLRKTKLSANQMKDIGWMARRVTMKVPIYDTEQA